MNPYKEANDMVAGMVSEAISRSRTDLPNSPDCIYYQYGYFKGATSVLVARLLKQIQDLERARK